MILGLICWAQMNTLYLGPSVQTHVFLDLATRPKFIGPDFFPDLMMTGLDAQQTVTTVGLVKEDPLKFSSTLPRSSSNGPSFQEHPLLLVVADSRELFNKLRLIFETHISWMGLGTVNGWMQSYVFARCKRYVILFRFSLFFLSKRKLWLTWEHKPEMSNLTELFKIFVKNNNLKLIEWNDFFNLLNNFG
jgi:hypothetical protein